MISECTINRSLARQYPRQNRLARQRYTLIGRPKYLRSNAKWFDVSTRLVVSALQRYDDIP